MAQRFLTLGSLARKDDPPKRKIRKDVNLPDESAGEPVGKLMPGEESRDPKKRGLKSPHANVIFGGDPDDPRWAEHLGRRLEFAKDEDEAAEANRDIEIHMRGGKTFFDETRTDVSPAARRQIKRVNRARTLGNLAKGGK
jgi:hypothetical protein